MGLAQKSTLSENFLKNYDFSIFCEKFPLKCSLSLLNFLKLIRVTEIIVHMAFLGLHFCNVEWGK